ncbi:MAG: sigA 2 [Gemmataceae bacterium]|nr:sigA 2 [Gemmataceae bacterium]
MSRTPRPRHGRAVTQLDTYLRDIRRTPLLSAEEERELARLIARGDSEARDRLVRANLRLVVRIAQGYAGQGLPLPDLISEGNLGLLSAASGYDPDRNTRFSTYASYWVKKSIRLALVSTTRTVRVTSYAAKLLARWHRTVTRLKAELRRVPTDEEVAARLGVKRKSGCIDKASRLRNPGRQGVWEGAGVSVDHQLPDGRVKAPDVALVETEELVRLMHLLGELPERTAIVLRQRFGLNGEDPLTLEGIGVRLGLTRERVHQIEKEALAELAGKM